MGWWGQPINLEPDKSDKIDWIDPENPGDITLFEPLLQFLNLEGW